MVREAFEAGHTPAIVVCHLTILVPRASVAWLFEVFRLENVAEPTATDQRPVPKIGVLPVSVVTGLLIQSVCVAPTVAGVGG